jgi:uncharacterized protein YjbI with pentapeptide repeats
LRQSELKAILKDHKLWIQSDGKQGKRAILRNTDLRLANLQRANLQRANLQRANLRGAYLEGANLVGADLYGANLHGAYLEGANLQGADLEGANLMDAKFTTNFKKVRWFECATFSEDQIPWVVLHPKYPKWVNNLKWVKAEQLSA